jgi:hypothetical protein
MPVPPSASICLATSPSSCFILLDILSNASNMFTISKAASHCLAKKQAYSYALNDDSEPSIATRILDIVFCEWFYILICLLYVKLYRIAVVTMVKSTDKAMLIEQILLSHK